MRRMSGAVGWEMTMDLTSKDGPCPRCVADIILAMAAHPTPVAINTMLTALANILLNALPADAADDAAAMASEFLRLALGEMRAGVAMQAADTIGPTQGRA